MTGSTAVAEITRALDCPSCGTTGQTKARCEACGFTFPQAAGGGGDDALSLFLGLVCTNCDAYNDAGTAVCASCGRPLEEGGEPAADPIMVAPAVAPAAALPSAAPALAMSSAMTAPPSWMTPPTGSPLATNFAMKKVDLASLGPAKTGDVPPGGLAPPTLAPRVEPLAPPVKAEQKKTEKTPPPPSAPPAPSSAKQLCWRCSKDLEPNDKFCRNCGARTDGGNAASTPAGAPAATQMISALKLPTTPTPASSPPGATQILPAFKAAQQAAPAPSSGGPSATLFFGAATAERVAKLILVRGQSQFGNQWRLQSGETVIGRSAGMVLFPDDNALAPKHAKLVFRGADLFLEPEPSLNGCFLKLREPVKLVPGDEFVIGAQRLRLVKEDERAVAVPATSDAGATKLLGSMIKPNPPIALLRVAADPRFHELYFRAQRLLTIGRVHCDVNFPSDGFVSERHAQLTHEGGHVLLEDLKSRNGTYARVMRATKLVHGDLLLLGDQVLRIELPQR